MKAYIYFVLPLCMLSFSDVFAQGFIETVENPVSKECYITLISGIEFKCELRSAVFTMGSLKSINIKNENGESQKYKAEDVKLLRAKMSDLARLEAIVEGSSSINEMMDLDFDEIINREYIIYEQALLPKKKDKYALLQLVNPGFDERLKVYQNPTGQESGGLGVGDIQLTGGKEKSYLVVKDGEKSIKVKKGSYKKDFPELFGDCDKMKEMPFGKKPKFKDMALHVLYYNKYCE